ncbi:MAG TPA: hypothetical protein VF912_04830 [Anaeromyxobacter sp.]
MESLKSTSVTHYFDTLDHRILCGVPGFDRSTKHSRAVTCPSCVGLLHGKESAGLAGDPGSGAGR